MKSQRMGAHDLMYRPARQRSTRRSEFDFINLIRQRRDRKNEVHSSVNSHSSTLLHGIGDDAAVIHNLKNQDTVITSDLLIEDIDFRRDTIPPRLLGHKALAVSLSDIAAMGARPRWALLSIGVPHDIWESNFLDEFYAGFDALADLHAVTLIGGDISQSPTHIIIDSIVVGESSGGRIVRRAGAQPGDLIYVTGMLGGAAAGLRWLASGARLPPRALTRAETMQPSKDQSRSARSSKRIAAQAREQLMLRQLRPHPRVAWGRWLGEEKLASAMIDISDGLSSDLAHLCRESSVGATIEAARIPIDSFIEAAGQSDAGHALTLALHGGEDFELLFTVRPRLRARLPKELDGIPVTPVGEVTGEAGRIKLVVGGRTRLLRPQGFKHFKR